jgi:hypothetical protein
VKYCLLVNHAPVVQMLLLLHEWKIVYSDKEFVILVPTTPGAQADHAAGAGRIGAGS